MRAEIWPSCPKTVVIFRFAQPNPPSMNSQIAEQCHFRPPLPSMLGCQNYREQRELLVRIDALMEQAGTAVSPLHVVGRGQKRLAQPHSLRVAGEYKWQTLITPPGRNAGRALRDESRYSKTTFWVNAYSTKVSQAGVGRLVGGAGAQPGCWLDFPNLKKKSRPKADRRLALESISKRRTNGRAGFPPAKSIRQARGAAK